MNICVVNFRVRANTVRVLIGVFAIAATSGCAAPARLHVIQLGAKTLSTTQPLIRQFVFRECNYWLDDQGLLCVAFSSGPLSAPNGSGKGPSFQLSLELPGVMAGSARDYAVTQRTLRAISHDHGAHERFGSLFGVVSVWRVPSGKLVGRFRIHAKKQLFNVLAGWGWDSEVLLLGEFSARPKQTAGEAILEASEGGGLSRPPYQPGPRIIQESPILRTP